MRTDAQSDVTTQHWTAKTKREEQDQVVHQLRNNLMRTDQSDGLRIEVSLNNFVQMRGPTDLWKRFQDPAWIPFHETRSNDKEEHHNNRDDLKRDGVHVDRDVGSEESGSTLVTVEEGRGNLQHIHLCVTGFETN
jgi:hypothetical protein